MALWLCRNPSSLIRSSLPSPPLKQEGSGPLHRQVLKQFIQGVATSCLKGKSDYVIWIWHLHLPWFRQLFKISFEKTSLYFHLFLRNPQMYSHVWAAYFYLPYSEAADLLQPSFEWCLRRFCTHSGKAVHLFVSCIPTLVACPPFCTYTQEYSNHPSLWPPVLYRFSN